jgi:hypothetical protein
MRVDLPTPEEPTNTTVLPGSIQAAKPPSVLLSRALTGSTGTTGCNPSEHALSMQNPLDSRESIIERDPITNCRPVFQSSVVPGRSEQDRPLIGAIEDDDQGAPNLCYPPDSTLLEFSERRLPGEEGHKSVAK